MKTLIHFHLIIITSVLLSADSCNDNKNTVASSTTTTQSSTTTTNTTVTQEPLPVNPDPVTVTKDEGGVRFSASFISIGEGIDGELHKQFVQFLDSYPKKIACSPASWGREGEKDYCLALNELSATEQTEFVKKAKELLSKSDRVIMKENSKCDHGTWPQIQPPQQEDNYRLVIGFFSIGEGIDTKVHEVYKNFLTTYKKPIAFEPTKWGREGEIDYCLKLNELTPVEQEEFVKKSKDLLIKSKLVHVNENAKCVHKH